MGSCTYQNTFNNRLHSYVIVVARNLIKKYFLGRNLSFKQFPFILRYLCNMREPLHDCVFLLSAYNNEKKPVNTQNFAASQIVITSMTSAEILDKTLHIHVMKGSVLP